MENNTPIDRLDILIKNIKEIDNCYTEAFNLKEFILEYYSQDKFKYACAVGAMSIMIGELLCQLKKEKK